MINNKFIEKIEITSIYQTESIISEYADKGFVLELIYDDVFSDVSAGGACLVIDHRERIIYIE